MTLTYFSQYQRQINEKVCYHHSYNLYYFHINANDPYDTTQIQVQRWVTLTYFSRSQSNKGRRLSSLYLHTYNLYYFHINTSDPYDETQDGYKDV